VRNYTDAFIFRGLRELARRLLNGRRKLVNNTVLYSLVIYSIGCVIPTQLDREQTPTNYPPVWVTSMVMPPFGPLAPAKNTQTQINLFASDPNINDQLVARVFLYDAATKSYQIANTPAVLNLLPVTPTSDPSEATIRAGNFEPSDYCANLTQGTYFLYAFVADRPFMGNTNVVDVGGLSDSNHWELMCP
jgi:hypothetical protein